MLGLLIEEVTKATAMHLYGHMLHRGKQHSKGGFDLEE